MGEIISIEKVKSLIISLRGQDVILASDVAKIYGVETKRVNEAVKNNPDKFPEGFIIELTPEEKSEVVENFDHLQSLKFAAQLPKAFTERGLYMLATILRSPTAIQTTFTIINTFAQVRELKEEIAAMHAEGNNGNQTSKIEKIGALIADIMMPELKTTETEASMEVNLVFSKFTYTVKRTRMQDLKEKLTQIAERMLDNGFSEEEIKKYLK